MAHESDVGTGFLIGFGFKGKYGSHLGHVADDILRPTLVPGPYGGRDIVHHRNAQGLCHMGDFHIKTGIIDADQDVRFFIDHGLSQHVPKVEKERNVL